jgi:hypothetical protein
VKNFQFSETKKKLVVGLYKRMTTPREKELAICNFLMKICSKERFIEIKRQILSEKPDFEPYVGFKRISRNSDGIDSESLKQFFTENLVKIPETDTAKLIRHYSTLSPTKLTFKVHFFNSIKGKISLGFLEHDSAQGAP